MSETPRCCWYQSPSAFGSLARKKNPPIPVTFSISVPPAIPAGGAEGFGGTAVCAAMPSWLRPKMKLDPKANDRVRSSWRLRESIPSPFREERGPSYDTCTNGILRSVKMRFWASCQILGSYPETEFWDVWAGHHPLGRLTLKPDKCSLHHGSASDETAGWDLARKTRLLWLCKNKPPPLA